MNTKTSSIMTGVINVSKGLPFTLLVSITAGFASAGGSLIGDSINWSLDSGALGGGSGSVVVVNPGIEVDVETITFITNRRANLYQTGFTLNTSTQSLTVPETIWTFSDLDFTDRQTIRGVTQTSSGAVNSIEFTEDSVTVILPEVGGGSDISYSFDVLLESVVGLAKDEINWSFNAGVLGGISGSAVIGEGIEANYTAPSPFPVHSHADFTEDTLTLSFDPAGLSSFEPSVWTITDLDWLVESGLRTDIAEVVQTSGTPVDSISVTGSSITINVPRTEAAEFTFSIHPVPVIEPELVGPADAWFGIDNLEITYSGGTELFDVRFDQRSFIDAFGVGAPDLPFSNPADVESALLALGAYLNSTPFVSASQLTTVVPVPGGVNLDDGFIVPFETAAGPISSVGNLDFSGPLGWRYFVRDVSIELAQDLVQSGKSNLAWAVFSPVSAECSQADLAEPFGELDFFDVSAFLDAFGAQGSVADLTKDGQYDFFDVSAFLDEFAAGCP